MVSYVTVILYLKVDSERIESRNQGQKERCMTCSRGHPARSRTLECTCGMHPDNLANKCLTLFVFDDIIIILHIWYHVIKPAGHPASGFSAFKVSIGPFCYFILTH